MEKSTQQDQRPLAVKAMTPDVIAARLEYKAPTPDQVATMRELNEKVLDLGLAIGKLPEGLMKITAVADLVKLRMVINAAVIGDGIPAGSLAKPTAPAQGLTNTSVEVVEHPPRDPNQNNAD